MYTTSIPAGVTLNVTSPLQYASVGSVTLTAVVTGGTGVNYTGTVTFFQNGVKIGNAVTISSNGYAWINSTTIPDYTGTYSITANYSGDSNNNGCSTATATVLKVQYLTNGYSYMGNTASIGVGQTVTFTAYIGNTQSIAPTGTVTFYADGVSIGTSTLSAHGGLGQATITDSTLTRGTHSITASYGGDTNNMPCTLPAVNQVVLYNTSVALSSTINPSTYNQSITLTATLSGGSGYTGTIGFYVSGSLWYTGVVSGGTATFTIATWSAGTWPITATYSGDSNNMACGSTTLNQVVNQRATSVAVSSSLNPVYQSYSTSPFTVAAGTHTITFQGLDSIGGDNTVFIDQITGVALGDPGFELVVVGAGNYQYNPTGSPWTFSTQSGIASNGSIWGNPNAAQGAQAAFIQNTGSITQTVSGWTAGTYTLSFNAASRAQQQQNFTVLVDGAIVGVFTPVAQTATLTATVSVTCTGTVTFNDGGTNIGTGTVSGTTATLVTAALSGGTHVLKVAYGGDSNNSSSAWSTTINQVVKYGPTTALSSSLNPSAFGQSTTLTATLSGGAGYTGTVTFRDSGTYIGIGTVSSGVATLAIATLSCVSGGTHPIIATYSGDANNTASSAALSQVVSPPTKAHTSDVGVWWPHVHTTNAFYHWTWSPQHTTDITKAMNNGPIHTTDVGRWWPHTHTTSITVAMNNGPWHTTNSYSHWVWAQTHTADIKLENFNFRIHTTDIEAGGSNTHWYTSDVKFWASPIQVHSTDITNANWNFRTHTSDSDVKGPGARSHTTDTFYHWTNIKTHSADILLWVQRLLAHTVDSDFLNTSIKTHSTSIAILSQGVKLHLTDVDLHGSPIKYHSTDIIHKISPTPSHSTDLVRKMANIQILHTTDLEVLYVGYLVHSTDSLQLNVATKTHGTDLMRQSVQSLWYHTDVTALYVGLPNHTTDLGRRATTIQQHTTNLVQLAHQLKLFTTDIGMERFLLVVHTTDIATLAGMISFHTTDFLLAQQVAPAPTVPRKFTYVDDYGTVYTNMWTITGVPPLDSIDITTIVEQPYVWGQSATGSLTHGTTGPALYRKGIVTIQRMILNSTPEGGYIIQSEGHNQYVGDILTSFNCGEPTMNPFMYILNNAVSDEAITQVDVGPCYVWPGDIMEVVWPDVNTDGSIVPVGTGETALEYDDVWHNG